MAGQSSIIFITGGVRSGKSSFAEKMAVEMVGDTGKQLHYIATGQASDYEMEARIAKHKKDRLESGFYWNTWEQSFQLEKIEDVFNMEDIVLLDCLTTLLNNEFFQGEDQWRDRLFQQQLIGSVLKAVTTIASNCQALIVVSNEVLNDVIVDDELVLTYQKMLAVLHHEMVKMAKKAFLVESGFPLLMKGAEQG
ncbi:bifunctional adenosylcobinamide kinase/adenosylcobinamide-phosphate guanylyltransferase [Bacillus sp. B15-48]|uniref:bifunctional adenosylcobinamide kinase/adenosylcobinamide-phosphate guanylyltransferase n=1 Tax=Bacillus sp. B15-48 TaxID=1548601 RepID=UPI00193F43A4|nr:bifunctional adenosylcobinamide kinase/adenosylcobinamide-phosphate guanylyltransferase [Bacillus sp. B15-48]MBM4763260.1 cobinamide kinase [Bacillus sp. B15-48]